MPEKRAYDYCPECGRGPINGTRAAAADGRKRCYLPDGRAVCQRCWKRLVWRPANGAAVDRDRAASRAWKVSNRERNRARDRAYARMRRAQKND